MADSEIRIVYIKKTAIVISHSGDASSHTCVRPGRLSHLSATGDRTDSARDTLAERMAAVDRTLAINCTMITHVEKYCTRHNDYCHRYRGFKSRFNI